MHSVSRKGEEKERERKKERKKNEIATKGERERGKRRSRGG